MKRPFWNTDYEYFWQYEYPFGEVFLKNIFPNNYRRKFSMVGDGIYNLIDIDDKIYHIKFTQARSMVSNDNYVTRDKTKNDIVGTIVANLKTDEYSVNRGKFITFKIGNFIAKIEVIKKMREPE